MSVSEAWVDALEEGLRLLDERHYRGSFGAVYYPDGDRPPPQWAESCRCGHIELVPSFGNRQYYGDRQWRRHRAQVLERFLSPDARVASEEVDGEGF